MTEETESSNLVDKGSIHIFVEGGVIQYIDGIPKGKKVIVVDWDTDGVEEELLTKLEAGTALVSVWTTNESGTAHGSEWTTNGCEKNE